MTSIELNAHVNDDGELKLKLPAEFSASEVRILVEMIDQNRNTGLDDTPWEDRPWTDEELQELMRSEPKTGREIIESDAIGSWADRGIEDSVAFVEELRRQQSERRRWPLP